MLSGKPETIADFLEYYNVRDIQAEITPSRFMTLYSQARAGWRISNSSSLIETLTALLCDIQVASTPKKKGAKKPPSLVKEITKGNTKEPSKHKTLTIEELQAI